MRFLVAGIVGLLAFAAIFLVWPEYRYQTECAGNPAALSGCSPEIILDSSQYRLWGGKRWFAAKGYCIKPLCGDINEGISTPDEQYRLQATDALAASVFAGFIAAGLTGMAGGYISRKRKRPPVAYK